MRQQWVQTEFPLNAVILLVQNLYVLEFDQWKISACQKFEFVFVKIAAIWHANGHPILGGMGDPEPVPLDRSLYKREIPNCHGYPNRHWSYITFTIVSMLTYHVNPKLLVCRPHASTQPLTQRLTDSVTHAHFLTQMEEIIAIFRQPTYALLRLSHLVDVQKGTKQRI